jgi:AcrR family transcriptional regulator
MLPPRDSCHPPRQRCSGDQRLDTLRPVAKDAKRPDPLYKPLPSGNRGIAPERVAHHQRMRLMGAMVHACAQHGYAEVTIPELSRLASVSLRDFYEHFPSKEACFLATHDEVVKRGTERVATAVAPTEDWREGLVAAFDAFFAVVRDEPEAAGLVVIEALTAGPQARDHRREAMRGFEGMLRQGFERARPHAEVDDVAIGAIVAGTRRVVYRHLRAGRADALHMATKPILDWAMLLWEAAGSRPLPAVPDGAGTGRRRRRPAPPPASAPAQERIIAAIIDLSVRNGYANVSMPAIAKAARCSTQTFYKHFASKDEAFTQALVAAQTAALTAIAPILMADAPWEQKIVDGVSAILDHCARNPLECELLLRREIGGPRSALDVADSAYASFVGMFVPSAAVAPAGFDPILPEAVAGGLLHIAEERVALVGPAGLPAIAEQVIYLLQTTVVGLVRLAMQSAADAG